MQKGEGAGEEAREGAGSRTEARMLQHAGRIPFNCCAKHCELPRDRFAYNTDDHCATYWSGTH